MAYGKNGSTPAAPLLAPEPVNAVDLDALHPHVRALVEALLAQQAHLAKYRAGTVHLRYHRDVVKVSLELVL